MTAAMPRRVEPSAESIGQAVEVLRAGGVVVFPTETVYGLGADATSDRAVAGIFAAKQRPDFNPLIVHVTDASAAEYLVDLQPAGNAIAQAFWPGPLTLVAPLKQGAGISPAVTAGLDTGERRTSESMGELSHTCAGPGAENHHASRLQAFQCPACL